MPGVEGKLPKTRLCRQYFLATGANTALAVFIEVGPRAYCICVIQVSLWTCGRLMSILSRPTLKSDAKK
jgi:hypothetical protein